MNPQPIKGLLDDPWSQMMTASIAGDEGAYRRLLEDIGRSVRAMARGAFSRAGVGDADVEDAVQETLLAIHLKRHTWDPGQPLAPWVYAIARHKVVDALRRRGRRKAEPIENFEEFLAAPEAEDPHALSDARKLLETLAPRQRDIVTSISLDGQSIARDGEAPVDVRGRGEGGAPSRAEVAWRGLAEVGRVKTSDFITALAADPVPEPIRLGRRVAAALAIGLVCSVALYGLMLGPRPDVAAAAGTMRFWLKFVDSFAFALPTLLLTLRLAYPDAKPRTLALWLIAPFILLAAGVVVELLVVPQASGCPGSWARPRCTARSRFRCWRLLSSRRSSSRCAPARRSIRPGPALWPGRLRRGSGRSSTPRPALAIRRCSWRPGIRSRRSSAWASARWPGGVSRLVSALDAIS